MDSLAGLASYDSERERRVVCDKGGDEDLAMQVIDISEHCDSSHSDSDSVHTDASDDDDFLHRPLSPSNPFLLICNSLCSSPSSAASIHVQPLSLPPPSKADARIPLGSMPDDLRAFLVAQQYPLVKDCEGESGLLPAWMTHDHVKLLSQLFDKVSRTCTLTCTRSAHHRLASHVINSHSSRLHALCAPLVPQHVKSEWEEADKRGEGGRLKGRDREREERESRGDGGQVKDTSMRGDKKQALVTSVSTSQASSMSSSSSSSFSASSQQAAPLYSIMTTADQPNPPPSSPHHYASYTPPRQLPSTPVPPPLLSPSLSKQTSRIAETIRRLYGLSSEEKGHKLLGHSCLTSEDQTLALDHKSDLLYGEVLPEGVSRMFDADHLDLMTARTVYDLGSGLGKLAMQAFLQFPHLDWVCGVELARSRSLKGFEAVRKLSKLRLTAAGAAAMDVAANSGASVCSGVVEEGKDGSHVRLTETLQSAASSSSSYSKCLGRSRKAKKHRYLELRCADLFTVHDAFQADVVICETKFPEEKYRDLAHFMSHMKPSVRVLTYEDLDVVYGYCHLSNPFVRLENNHSNDRFYTTWAPNYGYRFHLWRRRTDAQTKPLEEEKREEKQFKQE